MEFLQGTLYMRNATEDMPLAAEKVDVLVFIHDSPTTITI
jgi:hypothetical protein